MNASSRYYAEPIPTYRLYGDDGPEVPEFRVHFEPLTTRSRKYRWEIKLHRHDAFFQIFNLTAGHGQARLEDRHQTFTAPAAIFIPAGLAHGFSFSPHSDGTVLTAVSERLTPLINSDPRLAAFLSAARIVPLPPERDQATQAARKHLAGIADELAGRAAGRMAMIDAHMSAALVNLARATAIDTPGPSWGGERDAARIDRLCALIDRHAREHRPVVFYAGQLGVSATHLNRLSRRMLKISVRAMINRKLLAEAQRELVFTHKTVKSVAYSIGFSDPAYFTRFFRQQCGTTPAAFRAEARRRLSTAGEPATPGDTARSYLAPVIEVSERTRPLSPASVISCVQGPGGRAAARSDRDRSGGSLRVKA